MKKIVFALIIGVSTSVYGQLEYISRDGYEKIGEYRYNDRTGHIEYYEPQKLGRKDIDNWSNLLAAAYSASMYSAIQKAKLRDEYMLIADEAMKRARKALNAEDFRTMRKEAWNAYIYFLNVQKMVSNKSDVNSYIASAYTYYLLSLYLDENKFIEMYDYNIIKYNPDYEAISFLQERYSEIIREREQEKQAEENNVIKTDNNKTNNTRAIYDDAYYYKLSQLHKLGPEQGKANIKNSKVGIELLLPKI